MAIVWIHPQPPFYCRTNSFKQRVIGYTRQAAEQLLTEARNGDFDIGCLYPIGFRDDGKVILRADVSNLCDQQEAEDESVPTNAR